MPSLMCSALYWRRSIRSLRALQTEGGSGEMKQQDKEAERGVEEEHLTRSFLPGALLSYTFKHLAILIYSSIFPRVTRLSVESLFLTQLPCMSGTSITYFFIRRNSCLQKLLQKFYKNKHHHLDVLCALSSQEYLLQH